MLSRLTKPAKEIFKIDPLSDERWRTFVERHPRAGVFHTSAWLEVLHRTYGYKSVAYVHAEAKGALRGAVLLCEIKSWLTGKRLVSLPFSDHCEPLVENTSELEELLYPAGEELRAGNWKYIELRPLSPAFSEEMGQAAHRFVLHRLDLKPSLDELYKKLHVDSIRRKIQKGEKVGLTVESGNSSALLDKFYALHVETRRRQLVPPHPLKWFRNILLCLGDSACIRVAHKLRTPVSAVFTLQKGSTLVYKYGCSDAAFHNIGAMPFVFWDMIRDARSRGVQEIDLGRSELDNPGLLIFKDKWGASRHDLIYLRDPSSHEKFAEKGVLTRAAGFLISRAPRWAVVTAGNLLYPHVG